jgi:hypothetical protein
MESTATVPGTETDPEARQAIIDRIKAENPGKEVRQAEAKEFGEWVVYCTPTRPQFRMYFAKREEKDGATLASEFYLDSCVLYPDKKGLSAQLDRRPGLFFRWAGEVNASTGALTEVTSKKL